MKHGRYPYDWDEQGRTGFRVGYCDCGQKIVIPIAEAEIIATRFGGQIEKFYDKFRELEKPKQTLRQYLIEFLGGQEKQELSEQTLHSPSEVYYRK